MNRGLVIVGSGNVGRHVLSQLSAKGAQVRALTRKPDASRLPPQIPLVRGDPALPETLDSCLQNIDTVFLDRTKHRARSSNSPIRPRQIERLIENSGL